MIYGLHVPICKHFDILKCLDFGTQLIFGPHNEFKVYCKFISHITVV